MTPKLKFAIIGCGRIAQRHAAHIHHLATLVAVCDTDETKAHHLAQQYTNVATFLSLKDLLKANLEIDVIAICTPNGLHAQQAIACLQSGYHVLVEKPIALQVEDCMEMMRVATENHRKIFAIKQNRYNPPVAAVKTLIDEGRLGNIFSIQLTCFWNRNPDYYHESWKGTQLLDGGTLFTQFSHFIDLLYWMVGDVDKVQAFTGNYLHKGIIEFEDSGVVILQFLNGAIGTINYTVNSHKQNMEGSLTIIAEKGTVKIGGQYLNELEYQNIEHFTVDNLPKGNPANQYGTYVGSMSNHDKVYQNVIDVLQNNREMTTSAFEAMKTVEIIRKIYDSVNR